MRKIERYEHFRNVVVSKKLWQLDNTSRKQGWEKPRRSRRLLLVRVRRVNIGCDSLVSGIERKPWKLRPRSSDGGGAVLTTGGRFGLEGWPTSAF